MRLLLLLVVVVVLVEVRARRRVLSSDSDSVVQEEGEGGGGEGVARRLRLGEGKDVVARDPQEHLVKELPGLSQQDRETLGVNYAGHLPCDGASSPQNFLFYWLFEKPEQPQLAPLTIWMNGGPGCTSMDGLFLELGPLKVNKAGDVRLNPHSWHHVTNIMFLDQPVGTGLAYTRNRRYPKNDKEINLAFYNMLMAFFKLHPGYVSLDKATGFRTSRPIVLSGESHAGHYIPCMTKYILERNAEIIQDSSRKGIIINIDGIAIGNGWIDPFHQYDVSDYAHGQGLISDGQRHTMKIREKACQADLSRGKYRSPGCFSLLDAILDSSGGTTTGRMTMYDSRRFSKASGSYPPGHQDVEKYLNRKDVRAAIHSTQVPQTFKECTDPPYNALSHQDGLPATKELVYVLEHDPPVRVLLFSGQFDVICNHLGTEKFLAKLNWAGRQEWLEAIPRVWLVKYTNAGLLRQSRTLSYLLIRDAGHMVPLDKPQEALDMITSFLSHKPLDILKGSTKNRAIPSTVIENLPDKRKKRERFVKTKMFQ